MELTGDKVGQRTFVYANSNDTVDTVCRERGIKGTPSRVVKDSMKFLLQFFQKIIHGGMI